MFGSMEKYTSSFPKAKIDLLSLRNDARRHASECNSLDLLLSNANMSGGYEFMYTGIVGCPLLPEEIRSIAGKTIKDPFLESAFKEELIASLYMKSVWDIEKHKNLVFSNKRNNTTLPAKPNKVSTGRRY